MNTPERRHAFHRGDMVHPKSGYPQLCEVVSVEPGWLIRIRGVEWPSGYTVVVRAEDYQLVTGRLSK